MLVIKIELHSARTKQVTLLGSGTISNVGGTAHEADYEALLFKSAVYAKTMGVWRKGSVKRFPRKRLGPWDLLYQALRSAVGSRNPVRKTLAEVRKGP